MRNMLRLCLFTNCYLAQAQQKPVAIAVPDVLSERLQVGDTCYVAVRRLLLRAQPSTDGPANLGLALGDELIIKEVVNSAWVLVDYHSLDVGVNGYMARRYLRKKRLRPMGSTR